MTQHLHAFMHFSRLFCGFQWDTPCSSESLQPNWELEAATLCSKLQEHKFFYRSLLILEKTQTKPTIFILFSKYKSKMITIVLKTPQKLQRCNWISPYKVTQVQNYFHWFSTLGVTLSIL